MHPHITSQAQGHTARSLGLRLPAAAIPRSAAAQAIEWKPWTVVPRAKGFHVSREAKDEARTEALLNEVGRLKVFRSHGAAQAACNEANGSAS